ncbi:Aldehyde dehydrogenase family protein, partial [Variovorax sp. YR750]|uniref:aldehyde dehydrogenase family protein n=1 Tax=Variovorax sp. YR750 TaxID=1884384 RepID=UPI0008BDDECF
MPLTLSRPDLQRTENFIAGEWLCSASGRTLDVTDPATDALVAQVPDSDAADARAATDAAHAAFPAWRAVPAKQRAQILKRW